MHGASHGQKKYSFHWFGHRYGMAAGIPVEADPCMGFRYPSFAFFGIRICRRVTTWHEQCGRFRLNLPRATQKYGPNPPRKWSRSLKLLWCWKA